jgi:3-deoxy-D-manno-octulosonic-acid transferase
MIEPAALGKPVVVGPFTGNFAEPMKQFRQKQAMVEIRDAAGLREALAGLLEDPKKAAAMGKRAQEVVREQQGATDRHVAVILQALEGAAHDR